MSENAMPENAMPEGAMPEGAMPEGAMPEDGGASAMDSAAPQQPSFGNWIGSLWLFTILRFAIFFAIWGLLYLVGIDGLLAAMIAVLLSIPLSFVLLARPRARVAANIEARINARRQAQADLDRRLNDSD